MTSPARTTKPANADPAQWRALTKAAGVADLSAMGRLRITGADALDLLNRLTTNKLETLPPGTACPTVVTNGNGRVIDLLHLAALPDHILCLTSPDRAQTVIDWLDTYTFGEDITVTDVSEESALFALVGPRAFQVIASTEVEQHPEASNRVTTATVGGSEIVLWRDLPGGAEGFFVIVPADASAAVRDALASAEAAPVSHATWDAFRISNGFPMYGAEYDESANPLEARLLGAISDDKGCYTGQEVIARLLTYRKVQRRLMAAELETPVAVGTELLIEGETGGVLTSSAVVPVDRAIGLALVRMKHAAAGTTLRTTDGITATLAEPAYALATEPAE